ncbi:MAG: serine hydrolase [Anaerolineae bacterium]|nr:serine hydrolase [Anaerolineae bacterium]
MRRRNTSVLVRFVSILFLSATIFLTIISLIGYSRERNNYPSGMTIGGVPVGGLTPKQASDRILLVYNTPIETFYGENIIHIGPSVVGFQIDMDSMIAAADLIRTGGSFWGGFWNYLWNQEPTSAAIPLRATISEEQLQNYLKFEISSRYDIPPEPAQPIPGSTNFSLGNPGQTLDHERAVFLIEDALRSPQVRSVLLTLERSAPARPTLENLETLLQQTITLAGYDGVFGLYMLDLQTGQEIHFAMDNNEEISTEPDVAFTASSMIKIPIMVSTYIRDDGEGLDETTANQLLNMILKSENPPADVLMTRLNAFSGPLIVTEDMQNIGLENTFIAGYFCDPFNPCPLLQRFNTPANQRLDVFTDPDLYNQTTPSDMGMLMADIYQCANSGGGALIAAYPGKITSTVCKQMISILTENKIGVLIEAGVPEGTQIAHKHGWISDSLSGVIKDISDAAIVYSPGGNYVLVMSAYHPVQAIWDSVSGLFAQLSQVTYNYFNLPIQ